jgi:two-component system chemotaxis response regulator CheY
LASPIEKVIVLDDSDSNVLHWEMLLPEFKLQVFKSRAGAEALEIIEKEGVQMAIVTWELQSMPGTVLIQKARANKRRKRMPFIIYSKRMSDEDVALCRELGLENVISLPFDKPKIKETIQKILDNEANPNPVEAKLRTLEECIAEGRPTEALKMFGPDLSKKGPHLPRYKVAVAETFLQIGNLDKAQKAAQEALDTDENYLPALYLKARLFTIAGKHDDAIEVLRLVSEKSPKNIQSLLNLGSAYVSADKIEEAKKTVDTISLLDPDNKEVKDTKGKIALKEGDLSLAAQLLSETQNGDEIARFYNSLGISMVAKGEYDKGIETYQSAVKILSNKAKIHQLYFNLALAYRKKGDTENELGYFCESYVAEPAFEKAYASVARALQEAKAKGASINQQQVRAAAERRAAFLRDNPAFAEKIKAKLEGKSS